MTNTAAAVTELVTMGLEVLSDVSEVNSSGDEAATVVALVESIGLRSVLEVIRDAADAAHDAHDDNGTEASVLRNLRKFSESLTFAIEGVA